MLASEASVDAFLRERRAERAAEAARAATAGEAASGTKRFAVLRGTRGAAGAAGRERLARRELCVSDGGVRCSAVSADGSRAAAWAVPAEEVYRCDAPDGRSLALTLLRRYDFELTSGAEAEELEKAVRQWGMGERTVISDALLHAEMERVAAAERRVRPLRERRARLAAEVRSLQTELLGDVIKGQSL